MWFQQKRWISNIFGCFMIQKCIKYFESHPISLIFILRHSGITQTRWKLLPGCSSGQTDNWHYWQYEGTWPWIYKLKSPGSFTPLSHQNDGILFLIYRDQDGYIQALMTDHCEGSMWSNCCHIQQCLLMYNFKNYLYSGILTQSRQYIEPLNVDTPSISAHIYF